MGCPEGHPVFSHYKLKRGQKPVPLLRLYPCGRSGSPHSDSFFPSTNPALEVEEPPILSADPEALSLATQLQEWRQPALKGCFLEQTTPLPGDDGAWGTPLRLAKRFSQDWVFLSYWHWKVVKGPATGDTALPFATALGPPSCFPDFNGSSRPHFPVFLLSL